MASRLPILFNNPLDLDRLDVASPCPAAWEDMVGSDRVRFCASCEKNVFNLSGMRRDEATDLLRATEGKVCVRFYRRMDGTILTQDCPVGIAAVLRRAKRATLAAAAISVGAVATLLGFFGVAFLRTTSCELRAVQGQIEAIIPPPPGVVEVPVVHTLGEPMPPSEPVMGKIAVPVREVKGDPGEPGPRPKMGRPQVAPERSR